MLDVAVGSGLYSYVFELGLSNTFDISKSSAWIY